MFSVAGGFDGKTMYGLMLDANPSGQGIQRSSCAVFTDYTIHKPKFQALIDRTVAHEVGHVLNLAHEDASPGARHWLPGRD
jgi:hypothetical protein